MGPCRFLRTVTASTMIARFNFGRKVRCHTVVVENWRENGCTLSLEIRAFLAYNTIMEISLAPELEARLTRIASEAGKAANQVVQELVADYLDHDEWFKREVQKGLASLDGGKFVSHEEVGRQIERILRP